MRLALLLTFFLTCGLHTLPATPSRTYTRQRLVSHINKSIRRATNHVSKLPQEVLDIEGMSSDKVRHLLNQLCAFPNTVYLEVGLWHGATFTSALYNNKKSVTFATGIDNWSQFGGPKQPCFETIASFLPDYSYHILDQDVFTTALSSFAEPVTIYFYDGGHSEVDQEKAFTHFDPIFADLFIAVVDDWNWSHVRRGTQAAFKKLGYQVVYSKSLPARFNGDRQLWWNGLYVALLRKPSR